MKQIYQFFKVYYDGLRSKVIGYVISSIMHKALLLVIPYTTKMIIDNIQFKNLNGFIRWCVIDVLLLFVFQVVLSTMYYLRNYIEIDVIKRMRKDIFNRIMYMDYTIVKEKNIGYYIQRIFDDCEQVRSLIIRVYVDVFLDIGFVIGILIIMFRLNPIVSISVLILIPIFLIISKFYIPHIERANKDIIEENENLKTLTEELVNGSKDIRVNNGYRYAFSKLMNTLDKYTQYGLRNIKYEIKYNFVFITGIMNLTNLFIYIIGGYLAIKGYITLGTLTGFTIYFSRLWTPIESFMELPKDIKVKKISLNRLKEILYKEDNNQDILKDIPEYKSMEFKNLSISYEEREILKNVNFKINKGDRIAIRGANGSGKSTVANLFVKLIGDYSGEIYYNDINYRKIDPNEIRKRIILIPSDVFIFNGSIRENIVLDKEIGDINRYFKEHNLLKLFEDNERDLDTIITNNGQELSGGEKKIVQILRGVLQDGDVYILDEPLNYVDKEYKEMLVEFIDTILEDKTIIVISHDELAFSCCNEIYNLENQDLKLEEQNGIKSKDIVLE